MAIEPIPQHCGQSMRVTKANVKCDMCGYEEPHPSPEEAAKITEWPQHCSVAMGLNRTAKCDMCGYEETKTGMRP